MGRTFVVLLIAVAAALPMLFKIVGNVAKDAVHWLSYVVALAFATRCHESNFSGEVVCAGVFSGCGIEGLPLLAPANMTDVTLVVPGDDLTTKFGINPSSLSA